MAVSMRTNSGKGEERKDLRDTTMRDRELGRRKAAARKPKASADHRTARKD